MGIRYCGAGCSMAKAVLMLAVSTGMFAGACEAQDSDRGTSGLRRARPTDVGVEQTLLDSLVHQARAGRFAGLHAVLVLKDGAVVLEEYFEGTEGGSPHYLASITKSVTSALVGIAIARGELPSLQDGVLDARLGDLLPQYAAGSDIENGRRSIRLRHLLTMTAGLAWDEQSAPYDDPRNDWVQARRSADPIQFVLDQPAAVEPGDEFRYNGGLTLLLAQILRDATGMSVREYARRHLFGPLGAGAFEWRQLPSGITDTPGGLSMLPIDLAKFGQLYLQGGWWEGREVIPTQWVAASTRAQIRREGRTPSYGLHWWCGEYFFGGRSTFAYLASGHGGQALYVFPSLDLVVVMLHRVFDNPMGELQNDALLERFILPAVQSDIPPAEHPSTSGPNLDDFQGRYDFGGRELTVRVRNGKLVAQMANEPAIELTRTAPLAFRGTVLGLLDIWFEFERSAQGYMSAVSASQGFRKERFHRVPGPGQR